MRNNLSSLPFPLYDSVYGNEIPLEQYFIHLFGIIPSRQSTNVNYDPEIVNFFKTNYEYKEHAKVFSVRKSDYSSFQSLLVNKSKEIMIRVTSSDIEKNNNLVTLEIFYNLVDRPPLDVQINMKELEEFIRIKKKSNINLVKSEHGGLDTESYDLLAPDIDLEMNYGSDFLKIHDLIVKRLNQPQGKGIILFHGDPGTGKCVIGATKVKLRNKKTGEIYEKNIEDLM